MGRFDGRVAVVTGAGSPDGIGAACARALAAEGAQVVLGATWRCTTSLVTGFSRMPRPLATVRQASCIA